MPKVIDYTTYPGDEVGAETIRMYIEHGYMPGHFLTAVLSNDLVEAVDRADSNNQPLIPAIVIWLWNNAPSNCWRTPAAVRAWHEKFWPTPKRPGNRLDDGSNEAIADREDFDDHELSV